jgi:hypothetical protein
MLTPVDIFSNEPGKGFWIEGDKVMTTFHPDDLKSWYKRPTQDIDNSEGQGDPDEDDE